MHDAQGPNPDANAEPLQMPWEIRHGEGEVFGSLRQDLSHLSDEAVLELHPLILMKSSLEFDARYGLNACPKIHTYQIHHVGIMEGGGKKELHLVQDRASNQYYALRTLRKDQMPPDELSNFSQEKQILYAVRCPYIVAIFGTVQTVTHIGTITEFARYGPLSGVDTSLFSDERKKLIAAQVVMALEYLHACRIVHRNVCHESVILFRNLHVKLASFEDAGRVGSLGPNDRVRLNYLQPPETLRFDVGYEPSIDWWGLGIFLFELQYGSHPFGIPIHSVTPKKDYLQVLSDPVINFPFLESTTVMALITELLQQDWCSRIGCLAGRAEDVKTHDYFDNGTIFAELIRKTPSRALDLEIKPLSYRSDPTFSMSEKLGNAKEVDGF